MLTLAISNLNARSAKEEVDFMQSLLGMEKKTLVESYVKKVAKATDALVAMQFHQIEMYILSEIRVFPAGNPTFPEVKQ